MNSAISARIENPWRCLRHLRFEIGDFGQTEQIKNLSRPLREEFSSRRRSVTSSVVNEIFSTWKIDVTRTTTRSINVNASAAGKLGLHCSAFKHLFCVLGDKAAAYRADVYRFFEIPSCLDIEVDLLSSWSTAPTLRHATNFGYRIGDLPERILPRYYGNPANRNRKESHRSETDESWLMAYRILPWFPDSPAALDAICYAGYTRGWIFYRKPIRL